MTKRCGRCQQTLPATEFYQHKQTPSGLYGWCRTCARNDAHRRYRDPVDGERIRARNRRYSKTNRRQILERHRERVTGVSPQRYKELLQQCGGLCAICREPERYRLPNGHVRNLAVDHNHKTGTIRGLLCADCNRAIGIFRDSPALLRAAADYLERTDA